MTIQSNDILSSLSTQQKMAVEYASGPQLVIASAGSGKTRVLTAKIVYLINAGYQPGRLLALTFTNKAANEMKSRIADAAGLANASRIWAGTFHSIFLRILRNHADRIGFPHDFTIYDASDSKALVKQIIKDLNIDDKEFKASSVLSTISIAKNALVTPDRYFEFIGTNSAREIVIRRIYREYVRRCKAANAMDFDDILFFTNILLRDNSDIADYYEQYFQYVLVDEYQDTNFAQHLIITRLTKNKGNLCVVGDDAQSIYSFRGANIGNILTLKKRYPNLEIFKLERNYRSTKNIVGAAESLIKKNINQYKKDVFSENEAGSPVMIEAYSDDRYEADAVAQNIKQAKFTNRDTYSDYAILYRTNAQSRLFEEALRKIAIPYRIYGGLAFYQRKEVKDAICYFRVAVNPDDDEALRRIINYPTRGIGETTLKKLRSIAMEKGISLWRVISQIDDSDKQFNAGTKGKLRNFHELVSHFVKLAKKLNAYELGIEIINSTGILSSFMSDKTPEMISKKENIEELLRSLDDFVKTRLQNVEDEPDMSEALSQISLATDADEEDDANTPKVMLMTAHAAKGLEFKHVYITGVEDEYFPAAKSAMSESGIEEERRLLYVAITRAQKDCVMSYSISLYRNGLSSSANPSRFINDIDEKYVKYGRRASMSLINSSRGQHNSYQTDYYGVSNRFTSPNSFTNPAPKLKKFVRRKSEANILKSVESTSGLLKEGTRIRHGIFGDGTVETIEESESTIIIKVKFDKAGEKRLMLKFAKFEII